MAGDGLRHRLDFRARHIQQMSDTDLHAPADDPTAEGARARAQGRPRDACPYAQNSSERTAWLEGYDGSPMDRAPDLPMDNG
ncbi:Ribosome modulation factor [Methylorubrum suomiense]|uniref:Ribosome modulation factor n=2 Tax=Methylobacteriaceae TaxID=119045 RepID=A0ABQ4UNE1_9HYPH|nr:Ribosome modulation factor [Methylorubrum suomiense]